MKLIIKKVAVTLSLSLALSLMSVITVQAQNSAETSKGQRLTTISTEQEAEALQPGDTIAMVCAKCKSVSVTHIMSKDSKEHAQYMHVGTEHACPGCGGKIQVKKGSKETEVVHVCTKCGDASAFCCASKSGGSMKM